MQIHILSVPYDSGHYNTRMGAGPPQLLQRGLIAVLEDAGHHVVSEELEPSRPFRAEIATAFDLQRQVAERIRTCAPNNAFPLVLSGNCNTAVGTLSGIGVETIGVIWFDAHVDFNTPETTTGGFLDGMGMAMATGHCWRALTAQIPGFVPLADERVIYVGVRDVGAAEQQNLDQSKLIVIQAEHIHERGMVAALAPALTQLPIDTQRVYIHLDLDVLDPSIAPANAYAAADGLLVDDVRSAIQLLRERYIIAAAGVASYDPSFDSQHQLSYAAFQLVQDIVAQ
jgi:arginase